MARSSAAVDQHSSVEVNSVVNFHMERMWPINLISHSNEKLNWDLLCNHLRNKQNPSTWCANLEETTLFSREVLFAT